MACLGVSLSRWNKQEEGLLHRFKLRKIDCIFVYCSATDLLYLKRLPAEKECSRCDSFAVLDSVPTVFCSC